MEIEAPPHAFSSSTAHNIASIEDLSQQVQSWQDHRNQRVGAVNWQFRTSDARINLKRLFPVQQPDSL